MRANSTVLPVAALIVALGFSGSSAAGAERDRHGRDRNGQASEGRARERQNDTSRSNQQGRDAGRVENQAVRPQAEANRRAQVEVPALRGNVARPSDRRDAPRVEAYRSQDYRGDAYRNDHDRRDDHRRDGYRDSHYRPYVVPRVVVPVHPVPRHYYGPGGNYSIYFGWGSGYLFGAPYSGRVYGYVGPPVYGARVTYGDVRLQVRPRDAAVYVDGYYAGIVDDFDGVFQRLTLTVGPHQIELAAPGLEPRVFDVYVDPARTVDVRMDLLQY